MESASETIGLVIFLIGLAMLLVAIVGFVWSMRRQTPIDSRNDEKESTRA